MNFHMQAASYKKGKAKAKADYITRRGFPSKQDVVARGYRNLPAFAQNDPNEFWEAADKNERSNGCAMREYVISLPNALTDTENLDLSEKIIKTLAGPLPCEYAYHRGNGSISGEDNPHLHLGLNERGPDGYERDAEQHFRRANSKQPFLGGAPKTSGGKSPKQMKIDLIRKKEAVCDLINAALAAKGVNDRVDHRSNRAKGSDRAAEPRLLPSRVAALTPEDREKMRKQRKKTGNR